MHNFLRDNIIVAFRSRKKFISCFLFLVVLAGCWIFLPQNVLAATSYFSPSSGNFGVGNIFTVNVMVNSEGVAINNAEGTINFPGDLLEIVSVSKAGSIFSLWVEEPAFSNTAGTLSFGGGLPTPGFTGAVGKILSVVFRVKKEGSATLLFSSTAIRANDGYGTNVFTNGIQAFFSLISQETSPLPKKELPIVPAIGNVIGAPHIISSTHPDQNTWYADKNPKFSWDVSASVTAERLLVGSIPNVVPTVVYQPPVGEKELRDFADGIWYFHVQFRDTSGWGNTAHFRFMIDTEKPDEFIITPLTRNDMTDPRVKFKFTAHDRLSGIDHYEVSLDGKESTEWRDEGNKSFETPILGPGSHTLVAKAVDRAGNTLLNSIEFSIEPLTAPIILDYPKELTPREILVVRGTTYPDATVTVWLQKNNNPQNVLTMRSDDAGIFTFVSNDGLETGVYNLRAKVTDDRGASSNPSESITIVVKQATFLVIGTFAVGVLSVLIPLIALIILLILMVWYGWRKYTLLKKRLRKEVDEAESALHKAFDLLKDDIREQIRILKKTHTKRNLTNEEETIIRRLGQHLGEAEKFVKKEIDDIEKEVK